MKKLISMTDFVLNFKGNTAVSHKAFEFARKSKNYATFLKQPLILGMFVPCDEYGNVLKECQKPDKKDYWSDNGTVYSGELYRHNLNEFEAYRKAKEKVLFNTKYKIGTCYNEKAIHFDGKCTQIISNFAYLTIEDIAHWNFELTESAIKQIFGDT